MCGNSFLIKSFFLASGRFEFDRVKQAMLKFKEINGPVLVIQRFVIPADNLEWPEELWGMKLGIVIKNIKYGNAYKDKLDELIGKIKNHPALEGYHLIDEPQASTFPMWAKLTKYLNCGGFLS